MKKSFLFVIILFMSSLSLKANIVNKNTNSTMLCALVFYPNASQFKKAVDLNCGYEFDEFTFKITTDNHKVAMFIPTDSTLLNGTAIYDTATNTYKKTLSHGGFNFNFEYKVISGNIIEWLGVSKTN